MSRQQRRRQQRVGGRQQTSRRWLLVTAGGLVSAVVLVGILLAVAGVFSGGDSSPIPNYALAPQKMGQLASTGHDMGSPDAPVTILEFGDFQ